MVQYFLNALSTDSLYHDAVVHSKLKGSAMSASGPRLPFAVILTMFVAFAVHAQRYTNATLVGPWLLLATEDSVPAYMYMWFDGAGTLVDVAGTRWPWAA